MELVARFGVRSARRWYWQHVLRSTPWLVISDWRRVSAGNAVRDLVVSGVASTALLCALAGINRGLSCTVVPSTRVRCGVIAATPVLAAALCAWAVGHSVRPSRGRRMGFAFAPGSVAATICVLWTIEGVGWRLAGSGTAPRWYLVAVAGATLLGLGIGVSNRSEAAQGAGEAC